MDRVISIGDLVCASVTGQLPLDFIIPAPLLNGGSALYLGDGHGSGKSLSYVLYSGTVLVISKEKLKKCTTTFAQV